MKSSEKENLLASVFDVDSEDNICFGIDGSFLDEKWFSKSQNAQKQYPQHNVTKN